MQQAAGMIEDETNGLLTYDREIVKVDAERIVKINRELLDVFENAAQ